MPKELHVTAHAAMRMRNRDIRMEWVEKAVYEPDWTEADPNDREIERRFGVIPDFGGRILRVACVETGPAIRVISVMFDRNARHGP